MGRHPSTVVVEAAPSTLPLRRFAVGLGCCCRRSKYAGFVHPGLLHLQSLCPAADWSDNDCGGEEEEAFVSMLLPTALTAARFRAAGESDAETETFEALRVTGVSAAAAPAALSLVLPAA